MKIQTSHRMGSISRILIAGIVLAACSISTATESAVNRPLTQTERSSRAIRVPRAVAPVLDGNLSTGEWDQALVLNMSHGGTVYLQHDGAFLYVGINAARLGYGSLCWQRDDEVWILHSSAALGSAVYQSEGASWRLLRDFEWCCRSIVTTSEREELFAEEGWMATIGDLGRPGQMEYQIAWEGEIRLAVISQTGQSLATTYLWPQSLVDDCVALVLGSAELMDPADFDPESWSYLIADGE